MVRLLEYPLEGGGSVPIQVEDGYSGGSEVTRGWGERDRRVIGQAQESFEQAAGRVQPGVQALLAQVRSLADSSESVSLEFGLELGAEVGAFVANASSKGHVKVSPTWRPRAGPDQA